VAESSRRVSAPVRGLRSSLVMLVGISTALEFSNPIESGQNFTSNFVRVDRRLRAAIMLVEVDFPPTQPSL
jgi:hypothetical protein